MTFVGPKTQAFVSGRTGVGDAGVQQALPQTKASGGWIHQEQSQLGNAGFAGSDTKDRSKSRFTAFGNPGPVDPVVSVPHEIDQDFGNKRLERRIKPFIGGIKFAVTLNQPAGVADPEVVKLNVVAHRRIRRVRPWLVNQSGIG